ncbi:LysR family transcriptional regulator [Fertoebacter nigrum]|uniref:LysR family transcriptional regulator n=1 Tax=Fertoeibacter niger TaxID=2656921 RepID=A0A8X8KSH1_9RHOB|nr:LysR substrate-binding domain-containing protein [Fertoeibacter niger]NUB46477.1 LysR family transcriptional regulator [Fertoeibacter niger]
MKLSHFRHVVAVSEQGSLRAAARHLNVEQSAISRSIRELENELGTPLFERHGRGAIPTKVGESFVNRAIHILNEVRRASDEVEQVRGGYTGKVVVGLSTVAHIVLLPKLLEPYRRRYPDVQLDVVEGLFPSLQSSILAGSIDFYIGPPPEYSIPPEMSQEKLFDNTRQVVARKGHPLSQATSLAELSEAKWVTTSITAKPEEELRELFAAHGLPPPKLALRAHSALTLIVSVAYSDLLAMAPSQIVEFPLISHAVVAVPVVEVLPAPPIVLVQRFGLHLTPAAELFADFARRVALQRYRQG